MHGTLPAASTPRAYSPKSGPWLLLRLAAREMRAGLRGFAVFVGCIALGVAAISGVSAVASSLVAGIVSQGRVILGGDVALSLVQRIATPAEIAVLSRQGRVTSVANLRAMAVAADSGAALVELKAVGPTYPEVGSFETQPDRPLTELLGNKDEIWGAVADPALFARLDLKPGARVTIGQATIELRGEIVSEPDKLGTGIGFGPRLVMSQAGLERTGLVQPGSLMRWTYRVALPNDSAASPTDAAEAIRADLPDAGAGWEVRTRDNADPRFARSIERFTQFLTLVGLTALLVGGVGVANAVAAFVDRKRADIGTYKSLGATGGRVVAIYLVQVAMVAAIGIAIGLAVGAAIPFAVSGLFASVLPVPIDPVIGARGLGVAALYGLLTALAFSLPPLGRAHGISVAGLFRDRIAPAPARAPMRYLVGAALCGAALVGLAITTAGDVKVALLFVAAAAIAFAMLRLIAAGLMVAARRLPHARTPFIRLAIANLHRPGALTPSLVLSLGLGITLLVTLATIDGNLREELGHTLPDRAPNFFFIDIPGGEADAFRAFLRKEVPDGIVEATPMMRGRITALGAVPVAEAKAAPEAAWVLDGDRGITYAADVPEGSTVVAGRWWGADPGPEPLVSVDAEIARGLGVGVGDTIGVNVLGRPVTARIANLRRVDWRRIGIGFVLVFSPPSFAGAPHTELMTVTLPKGSDASVEPRLVRAAAQAFPAVSSVRVKDALEAVNAIVSQLVFAIRAASSVALVASLLVLAGALAAGHRARLYDAVVLKTLGATRGRLLGAYLAEYGALGVATAAFGILAGTAAAWVVVTQVMKLAFTWTPAGAIGSAALAVVVAVGLGLLGTWRILGQKPARHLRDL